MSTQKSTWVAISQASLTVLAGDTTDVNTFAVNYPGAAAFRVNPLAKQAPLVVMEQGSGKALGTDAYHSLWRQKAPITWCGLSLTFLLRNATTSADGAGATCNLWMWKSNGHAIPIGTLDLVASTAAVTVHPKTYGALGDFWAYADTIVVSPDETGITKRTTDGNDMPGEIRFDLRGSTWLFADFKCDQRTLGSKDASDAICLASWVGGP